MIDETVEVQKIDFVLMRKVETHYVSEFQVQLWLLAKLARLLANFSINNCFPHEVTDFGYFSQIQFDFSHLRLKNEF